MTIGERIDNSINKAKGKANQAAGDMRDDPEQERRGRMQELKGDVGDVVTDVKEAFKKKD